MLTFFCLSTTAIWEFFCVCGYPKFFHRQKRIYLPVFYIPQTRMKQGLTPHINKFTAPTTTTTDFYLYIFIFVFLFFR